MITLVFYWSLTVCLWLFGLSALMAGIRAVIGPKAEDRVAAVDLMYICAMLLIVCLGIRDSTDVYFDAALLIGLFGFVSSSALAKFLLKGEVIEP